jgi:hypothetical protein
MFFSQKNQPEQYFNLFFSTNKAHSWKIMQRHTNMDLRLSGYFRIQQNWDQIQSIIQWWHVVSKAAAMRAKLVRSMLPLVTCMEL